VVKKQLKMKEKKEAHLLNPIHTSSSLLEASGRLTIQDVEEDQRDLFLVFF